MRPVGIFALSPLIVPIIMVNAFGGASVILEERFDTENEIGAFSRVSVASNYNWRWRESDFDGRFVEMNGFGADGPSDDWLILTHPLDLGDFENPSVSFRFITRFDGPLVELVVSSDYDAALHGAPGEATWTALPFFTEGSENEPFGGGWGAQLSDLVDLSGHKSERLFIGFHYTSTGPNSGEGAVWRIDDFIVSDSDPQAILHRAALDELEPWETVNVAGEDEWGVFFLADRNGAGLDGTFAREANEDWLISPPIGIGEADIPVLDFDYYTELNGPQVEVLVSSDYDASSHASPNDAQWTAIATDLSRAASENWTSFSGIGFYGMAGDRVHLAFRYTSIAGEAPMGRLIGISNVCIFKASEAPPLRAGFSASRLEPTTAEVVQFEARVSGGKRPYALAWDFGDGAGSEEARPSHQYTHAGTYTVSLTVTDALGGEDELVSTDLIRVVEETGVLLRTDFEGLEEDRIPGPWRTYSVASDAEWRLATEGGRAGALITGFRAEEASEDWLLSPVIRVMAGDIPVLRFDVYSEFDGPLLELLASSDYDDGDPNEASWIGLNVDLSGLPERVWTEVGPLSLAGLEGEVTLAFKYLSTGTETGDGRTYGVDGVQVLKETTIPEMSEVNLAISSSRATTEDSLRFIPYVTGGKHPYTYAWDFGDGTGSDARSPDYTYAKSGTYAVSLTVTDAEGTVREGSLAQAIVVIDAASVLLRQDFEGFDGDTPDEDWFAVSASSAADWELDTIGGRQGAFINGFGADEASDDWLISPVLQLGEGERGLLSLDFYRFFTGGSFEILAANDGGSQLSNDPAAANWLPISADLTEDDWTSLVDLEIPYTGEVRIAFHYTSAGTGPGDGQRIGVNHIQVVKAESPLPGDELLAMDFKGEADDPIPAPWTTVSLSSEARWSIQERDAQDGAFMNGFASDAASEDWLISPAFDLDFSAVSTLAFDYYEAFDGPDLEIFIGADYSPGVDPNDVHWTPVPVDLTGAPSFEWSRLSEIDLSGFSGRQCRLAYRYLSEGTEGGQGKLIGIDSVRIRATPSSQPPPETLDYDGWMAWNGHFKAGDPRRAPEADPDLDGLPNAVEHRFDLNPGSGTGYGNLPQLSRREDGLWVLSYVRVSDGNRLWTVQSSQDLRTWREAVEGAGVETKIEKSADPGSVLERVELLLRTSDRFFRVVLPE